MNDSDRPSDAQEHDRSNPLSAPGDSGGANVSADTQRDDTYTETVFEHFLATTFDHLDDIFYGLIGLFLVITAGFILWATGESVLSFFHGGHDPIHVIVEIIDRLLLGLMVIEILYTIRVSIRQHSLRAQPFLVVGLIAAVRRVLVISVEAGSLVKTEPEVFRNLVLEIGVLGVLVLIFVVSLLLMRRQGLE
jgi:hypothetical protein